VAIYAYRIRRKCHEWANLDPKPYNEWHVIILHYPLVKALFSYERGWRKFAPWRWAIVQPSNICWAVRMMWGWLKAWLWPEYAKRFRFEYAEWYTYKHRNWWWIKPFQFGRY